VTSSRYFRHLRAQLSSRHTNAVPETALVLPISYMVGAMVHSVLVVVLQRKLCLLLELPLELLFSTRLSFPYRQLPVLL